ncbi:uncharacterized protein ACRADG_003964 [Cochliomyia hominivorax]
MCISNENCGFDKQFATKVNGKHTEFVFQPFANRWFLLITQYGKVPNLYSVKFDIQRNEEIPAAIQCPVNHPQFHMSVPITITCKFGADKDEVRSGIQFLVNKSKLNRCPSEFVIGLGLKEINGNTLKEVAQVLDKIIV